MKTLILTPTQNEFDCLVRGCVRFGFKLENSKAGRLPVAEFSQLKATVAVGGTGKAQFAVHTQHLLDSGTDWTLVICAGGAGALTDTVNIGDVVIATAIVEHDYRNRFNQRPLPRFEVDEGAVKRPPAKPEA